MESYFLVLLMTITGLLAFIIRIYRVKLVAEQDQIWPGVRTILHEVLVKNKILTQSEENIYKVSSPRIANEIKEISPVTNFFDQKEIEKLRIVGIDGILICVYLLNQSSLATSIRTIHKTLQIPLSTVYRTIQRLEEKEMVISHYTTESPGKKYYKIAPEGESSILLLYELLGETEIPIFNRTKIKGSQTS
jgi:hypothetical protein